MIGEVLFYSISTAVRIYLASVSTRCYNHPQGKTETNVIRLVYKLRKGSVSLIRLGDGLTCEAASTCRALALPLKYLVKMLER